MTTNIIWAAIALIENTPGYEPVGADLRQVLVKGRLKIDMDLPDRAQTGLLGTITLGPEAMESSSLSLAQTLVHEQFHRHQNLLLKTVSFWMGVFTRTPTMKRYEQPAYQAAIDFLEVAKRAHPQLHREANAEQNAVRQVFAISFGGELA